MVHSPRFLQIVEDAKSRIQEVTVEDVRRSRDTAEDFVLIDTREDSEWAAGHAPGSIHLGKGIIERDIERQIPNTSKKLVLYCGGGFRSALAADALQKMGYTNVFSLAGGWRAWNEAGMPVESGQGS
jgi:rhodanese-related sulfurtransferase